MDEALPSDGVWRMAPEAQGWLRRAQDGSCGQTQDGTEGSCAFGMQGAFGLNSSPTSGLNSPHDAWAAAIKHCLERCRRCERCRYISVSLLHRDCSWFAACDLRSRPRGFLSAVAEPNRPERAAVGVVAAGLSTTSCTDVWSHRTPGSSSRVRFQRSGCAPLRCSSTRLPPIPLLPGEDPTSSSQCIAMADCRPNPHTPRDSFRQCGCSRAYPGRNTFASLLRQWVRLSLHRPHRWPTPLNLRSQPSRSHPGPTSLDPTIPSHPSRRHALTLVTASLTRLGSPCWQAACGTASNHPRRGSRLMRDGSTLDRVSWFSRVDNGALLSLTPPLMPPLMPPSPAHVPPVRPAECVSPHCLLRSLDSRWILFLGDSTHRAVHDSRLDLLNRLDNEVMNHCSH